MVSRKMLIALHNPYDNPNYAEVESAQRFIKAAQTLGHEARMVQHAYQIRAMQPDFVICMSYQLPKMTQYPTYGILTAPTSYFEQTERFIHNILSYDGYLTLSAHVEDWINDYLFATGKHRFLTEFAFTCHETAFQAPCLDNPELAYFGTNWDGKRHGSLFRKLSQRDYMQFYGPPEKWEHVDSKARRGLIPFDGSSSLSVYNNAGVGLCLHLDEFREEDTPSNRVFEISASGAVLISDRVPIVEKIFADTALYVDSNLSASELLGQIDRHMTWIKTHQDQARSMAEEANRIFNEHYSLEKLIPRIVDMHREVLTSKGYVSLPLSLQNRASLPVVSFIVRTGGRSLCYLQRCLDSIAAQSWPNLEVIIVNYKKVEGLEALVQSYGDRFLVRYCETLGGGRSTTLWAGLRKVEGEYFAILDDDDLIYPNHIAGLMRGMYRRPDVGLVYTGVLDVLEPPLEDSESSNNVKQLLWPLEKNDIYQIDYQDDTRLIHFCPFDPQKFIQGTNYIAPNALLAKTSLLDEDILEDPNAHIAEDYLLILLLFAKGEFVFSWEVTTEHRERAISGDNSGYWHPEVISLSHAKIKRRLFGRKFQDGKLAFQPVFSHARTDLGAQSETNITWASVYRQLFDENGHIPFHRRVIRIFKNLFFDI